MRFNEHYNLAGQHAFLSASNYHWYNYDLEKLDRRFETAMAAQRGTELHDLAATMIRMGIKAQRSKKTFNTYVNDAIGFRMQPEVVLFYSINAFGTTDTISFNKNLLRIHDLKTGVTRASPKQLDVYAALFCLEYHHKPAQLDIIQRIYQHDEIAEFEADPDFITHLMDKIVTFDKHLNARREESE